MNIKKSQLKEMIKAVAREAINERKKNWIKGAINPKHKGYCTPMSKKTCTPKRKALAKRFKKGIDEGENPFKGKEKKENPFKKKETEEPEEFETPEGSDDTVEEPTDTEEPTNMVSDEEPEDVETDGGEPVGPPEDIGGEESPVDGDPHEDEKEEILLIKVLGLIAKKLDDMHKEFGYELTTKDGETEEPPIDGDEIPTSEMPGEESPIEPEDEEEMGECGNCEEAEMTNESEPESKTTPLDDIVRLVKNKGLEDPQKEEYLVSKLFKHQTGWEANPEWITAALEKGSGVDEEGGGDEETEPPKEFDAKQDYKQRSHNQRQQKRDRRYYDDTLTPDIARNIDEDAYKVVAPHSYTDAKENKARRIQTEPDINEIFAIGENNTCPRCQTTLKESDEGKLRCDNPSCDCSKKLYEFTRRSFKEPDIKENHKVQARSYATVNDQLNDPDNVRDPENPASNGA